MWSDVIAAAAVVIGALLALPFALWARGAQRAREVRQRRQEAALVRQAVREPKDLAAGAAGVVVVSLNQTIVNDLKAHGGWNAQTAADVRAVAIERLKGDIGQMALARLEGDHPSLDAYLGQLVEYAVAVAPNRYGHGDVRAPRAAGG